MMRKTTAYITYYISTACCFITKMTMVFNTLFTNLLLDKEKHSRCNSIKINEFLYDEKNDKAKNRKIDDLDFTPFDSQGGKGKMYKLFGNEMNEIINELNEVLAA